MFEKDEKKYQITILKNPLPSIGRNINKTNFFFRNQNTIFPQMK